MKYSEWVILDELRVILKLIKEINDRIAKLADKIYEEEINRWENERG